MQKTGIFFDRTFEGFSRGFGRFTVVCLTPGAVGDLRKGLPSVIRSRGRGVRGRRARGFFDNLTERRVNSVN